MTEAEWMACDDPFKLLKFLRAGRWWRRILPRQLDSRRPNARKMRLLACAYESMYTPPAKQFDNLRLVLATAERYADGEATIEELRDRSHDPGVVRLGACDDELIPTFQWWEQNWSDSPVAHPDWASLRPRLCGLLRCIFNPFRPVSIAPAWLLWNDGTVRKIAQGIYDDRAFNSLPILADALEEAGCTNERILTHLRSGGDHYRGCFVIDALLSKS